MNSDELTSQKKGFTFWLKKKQQKKKQVNWDIYTYEIHSFLANRAWNKIFPFRSRISAVFLKHTLNGILDIFLVALRGDLRSFWLLALKGDNEYGVEFKEWRLVGVEYCKEINFCNNSHIFD